MTQDYRAVLCGTWNVEEILSNFETSYPDETGNSIRHPGLSVRDFMKIINHLLSKNEKDRIFYSQVSFLGMKSDF